MRQCKETQQFKVAALYKFVALPDYVELQPSLLTFCRQRGIRGTLLLAAEGINGTIAGSSGDIDAFVIYLQEANIFKNRCASSSI